MSNISESTDGGSLISSDNTIIEIQKIENQFFHGSSKSPSSTLKKKRNLPGTPDPNADVIALSPETLMARNRFVCEICNKGFQRDQNLQLHRRGHNLPWKLKQRINGSELKRRVYICPEPSCVHHCPARALGDLTGIKKHFSRKHGEKKWKCEKCSKKYAVQSDLKAHSKTCGSKEYKCDCGTVFSRRDSFITHRAFCDALIEESNRQHQGVLSNSSNLQTQFPLINQNPLPKFSDHPIPKTPLILPHDLMPIPPQPSNLSINNNNNNVHPFSCSSSLMSATALLQKAAQMGASVSHSTCLNSPMIHKGFVTTTMAPSSFGDLIIPQNFPTTYPSNPGLVGLEMINDIPMLNGIFDPAPLDVARKKMESKMSSGDTMTLDLLGNEGPKIPRNFQEQKKGEEEMGFEGFMENMNYFRQQGEMERQTWEI